MLAALATHGFEQLGERLSVAGEQAPPGEKIVQMALAAVRHALDHLGLFRLMFGHAYSSHPDTQAASDAAIAVVARHLSAVVTGRPARAPCAGRRPASRRYGA